jgi:choline dehydrogenase
LSAQGIDVERDAPEVGRNLADHLGYDHLYRSRVPTLNQVLRPWHGKLRVGLDFLTRRRGPLTLSLNQAGGFTTLHDTGDGPDIQLYFSPLSYTRAPVGTRPLMSPDPFPGFLFGFNPCRPTSRGHIEIASPDPFAAPTIQPNYLDTEYDRRMMVEGVRLMRRIAAQPALAAVIEERIVPAGEVESDAAILDAVRDASWTVFHACGTCRMGTDAGSVVDARLRVRGVGGLRVVDASIFPAIPTGNTNAPAIMIGERASDLILEDARETAKAGVAA